MALQAFRGNRLAGTVVGTFQNYTFGVAPQNEIFNTGPGSVFADRDVQVLYAGVPTYTFSAGAVDIPAGNSSFYTVGGAVDADRITAWRARTNAGVVSGMEGWKTDAAIAAAAAPVASLITQTTATLSGTYFPNTNESTATVNIEYKKVTDVGWTLAVSFGGQAGYAAIPYSQGVVGLTAGTSYQTRVTMARTTNNDTSFTSATGGFTTAAAEPTIVTNAATGVSSTEATLNATVDPNNLSTDVTFQYDIDSGAPYANETAPAQNFVGDGDQAVSKSVSGLLPSTTYFFRAKAVYPSGTVFGSELSFMTSVSPAAEAAQEDHVQVFEFNERKYGVASTINFAVASPAGTSSDRFFNAASPFVAGDVQISKDGGAFANVTSLPVRIGTTPNFALSLTALEMQAQTVVVMIVDQDGPVFRDAILVVRTRQELGNVDIDATQLTNVSAFKVTGQGTGHGIEAIGGASGVAISGVLGSQVLRAGLAQAGGASQVTLDAGANGNDDYYNGSLIMITSGTGFGQARVIADYVGGTKIATVDTGWVVNPDGTSTFIILPGDRVWELSRGELSAMPTDNAAFGAKMQLVYQRFAFKIDQSAILQKLYKADNATTLATRSVSDAAGLQTLGKLV